MQCAEWILQRNQQTQNELASRFVDRNCEKVRFVTQWGKWLVWDGRRWRLDDNDIIALRLARQFSNELWDSFGKLAQHLEEREELRRLHSFLKSANELHSINAFLKLARSDERIAIQFEELNTHPCFLNVKNGTIDLRSGTLRPHCQDDLITQLGDVEFHPDAKCPKWDKALADIFKGDRELIGYVRSLLGYSISALQGEHILPIAYGSGCNGKSTVWNVISGILGDYAGLANDSLVLGHKESHPTEKAFLYQKRFVPISEPEQSARLRESRVKELTGDGLITARRMHEDFWSFQRTHTFWLSTNHLPRIVGNDEGIWRRLKLIPFGVDLRTLGEPIPELDKILVREEGPGILNWLLQGFQDYEAFGFVEPEVVQDATASYRQEEDELGGFLTECCEVNSNGMASAAELFERYEKWGGKKNRTAFGRAMAERFQKDKAMGGEYRKQTVYYGVSLAKNGSSEGAY